MGEKTFRPTKAQKAQLRKASKSQVEAHFVQLPANARRERWLQKSNRYRLDCVSRYREDLKKGTVNNDHLIRYVGASSPVHVIDGWSFLGRALGAALVGDGNSAVHFAYYAELRAAISLLGSEGVGVLLNQHPIVPERGAPVCFTPQKSTHKFVWPVLSHWAGLKRAPELFDRLVSPNGMPLGAWVAAIVPGASSAAIAESWLTTWGIDLAIVDDDHSLRNQTSYRPSQFRGSATASQADAIELAADLWRLLEPSEGSRFPALEKSLLRRALRSVSNQNIAAADLGSVGVHGSEAVGLAFFLNSPDESAVLRMAAVESKLSSGTAHLEVISRAALLLALSTANCRSVLLRAGYTSDDIAFWWRAQATDRGLWGDEPDTPLDAWADIQDSLTNVEAWVGNVGRANISAWKAKQQIAADLFRLQGLELAGIWGLIP